MNSVAAGLDALYAELPKLVCQGRCQDSCGPVGMAAGELERAVAVVGRVPLPTVAQASRLACPLLTAEGKCEVYAVRPLVCRLWGLVESMPCPFGCVPERVLTDAEGAEFVRRSVEIAGPIDWTLAEAVHRQRVAMKLTADQERMIALLRGDPAVPPPQGVVSGVTGRRPKPVQAPSVAKNPYGYNRQARRRLKAEERRAKKHPTETKREPDGTAGQTGQGG